MTNFLILSSSSLKNINSNDNENFTFIFGDKKLKLKNIYAEFLSPIVSQLHKFDKTIDFIDFKIIIYHVTRFFEKFNNLFKDDSINFLQQISCGYQIEITESQSNGLKLISILLGNEELYNLII